MPVTISWTITDAQALLIREALAFHQGKEPSEIGVPELKAELGGVVRGWLLKKAEADCFKDHFEPVSNPLEE